MMSYSFSLTSIQQACIDIVSFASYLPPSALYPGEMAKNLTVAWSVLVDAATLGASIEAHASTKNTESNFLKFTSTNLENSAMRQLPNEVVAEIMAHVRQMYFIDHQRQWQNAWWCFRGRCSISERHLSEEEHESRIESFLLAEKIREDEDGQYWMDDGKSIYEEAVYEAFDYTLREDGVDLDSDDHQDNIGFMQRKVDKEVDPDSDDETYRKAEEVSCPCWTTCATLDIISMT